MRAAICSSLVVALAACLPACSRTPTQPTEPVQQATDVSGSWVVTLSASPSCRANVPEVAWEREFDVSIIQQDTNLYITRTSPTFFESCAPGNRPVTAPGRIVGQTLSFVIGGDTNGSPYSFPCLFDRLSPTEWLGITGFVEGTVTGNTFRGALDTDRGGALDLYESLPTATRPAGAPIVICNGQEHAMTLRRR
jgi:hypothetical protein